MRLRALLALFLLALVVAGHAAAATGIFVGAAEDDARSLDPLTAKSKMDLAAIAGLGTIRMTSFWSPGESIDGGDDLVALRNASMAARFDGVRLIVSVYARDQRTTPLTSKARGEFASYAASIARLVPGIDDFIVGNEPNLNLFWLPQFGAGGRDLAAASYELLLAKTYDALKAVSPDIDVIGGALSPHGQDKPNAARQTHSPTAFITDLGAAYRKTGRTRPIMDMFAIHPYLVPSRLPPTFAHPKTTSIGIADYPKLVKLLTHAFARTAQAGATLPIVYDEFGYQSQIPVSKRALYRNLATPAARDAITESRQALYYRQAIALAQCQPNVAGMLIFHVVDERDAKSWQSGIYYANGTPKTSLDGVRQAALAAQDGTFAQCTGSKPANTLRDVVFHAPPVAPGPLQVDFGCDVACTYDAQLIDLQDGTVAESVEDKGVGEQTVSLPTETLDPGRYEYALRVFASGRPGTAVTRYSTAFALNFSLDPSPAKTRDSLLPLLTQLPASVQVS
jgi:hypothetical protein